jgi:hypothetical protein
MNGGTHLHHVGQHLRRSLRPRPRTIAIVVAISGAVAVFYFLISPVTSPHLLPPSLWSITFFVLASVAATDAILDLVNKAQEILKPKILGDRPEIPKGHLSNAELARATAAVFLHHAFHAGSAVVFTIALGVAYSGLPIDLKTVLFGDIAGIGHSASLFISQFALGAIDAFTFFLDERTSTRLHLRFGLSQLTASNMEAGILVAAIKLYGFLCVVNALRALAAPITVRRVASVIKQLQARADTNSSLS